MVWFPQKDALEQKAQCNSGSVQPIKMSMVIHHRRIHLRLHAQGSSSESREHLGQGVNLALLHLLDTLAVVLAVVGTDTAEICRTGGRISAEVLGRLLTARGTRGSFGDGVKLDVLRRRLPCPLFANRRRTKDISNRVWMLSTRQLIKFPRDTIHDLDVPGDIAMCVAG